MINNLIFREIIYDSDEYQMELKLRDKVLRKPLGMSLYDANLESEINDMHLGVFEQDKLIAVLILTDIDSDNVKMRQVAVDEQYRSKKVGTQLVWFAEEFSRKKGYTTMVLNARKTAVGFYEKIGYEIISDEFLEIHIPHFKMYKNLIFQGE